MVTPEGRPRPTVFIGSSTEGHKLAQAVQVLLDDSCQAVLWSQGTFGLTHGSLESLVLALDRFDFAVLVLTADDMVVTRGVTKPVARDDVLFESGLFVGGLGRSRVFMLYDRTHPPDLPSDLAGVAAATFEPHTSGDLEPAIGAACTLIQRAIERGGIRDAERVRRLEGRGPIDHSTAMTLRHIAQGWWSASITAPPIVRETSRRAVSSLREGRHLQPATWGVGKEAVTSRHLSDGEPLDDSLVLLLAVGQHSYDQVIGRFPL